MPQRRGRMTACKEGASIRLESGERPQGSCAADKANVGHVAAQG